MMTDEVLKVPRHYTSKPNVAIPGIPLFECPNWLSFLETNYDLIKREIDLFLKDPSNISPFEPRYPRMMEGFWGRLDLVFWRMKHPNVERFPHTLKVLSQIPQFQRASFNLLRSRSRIKPHNGESDGYVRAHLGIRVPSGLPEVGFRVGSETRAWEEGRAFGFCDAQNHEAFNEHGEDRLILVVDVWRDEYSHCLDQSVVHNIVLYHMSFESRSKFLSKSVCTFDEVDRCYSREYLQTYRALFAYYLANYSASYGFSGESAERFWRLWRMAALGK